jgi:hypothetical protein
VSRLRQFRVNISTREPRKGTPWVRVVACLLGVQRSPFVTAVQVQLPGHLRWHAAREIEYVVLDLSSVTPPLCYH